MAAAAQGLAPHGDEGDEQRHGQHLALRRPGSTGEQEAARKVAENLRRAEQATLCLSISLGARKAAKDHPEPKPQASACILGNSPRKPRKPRELRNPGIGRRLVGRGK